MHLLGAVDNEDPEGVPLGNLITGRGMYNPVGIYTNDQFYHPFTFKTQLDPNGSTVNSGPSTRIGDTVEVTGLSIRGWLKFPSQIDVGEEVRFAIYRVDQVLAKSLWEYEVPLNRMLIPRQIDDHEKLHKVFVKSYRLNHKTGSQTMRVPVNIYKRFKKSKRIRFNETVVSDVSVHLTDYADDRYLLSITSTVPAPPNGVFNPLPPTPAERNNYPQFAGNFICYYRDS